MVFYYLPFYSLPSPCLFQPSIRQTCSLTAELGKTLLPGNIIYWLRLNYTLFWRWFLVLPQMVFVLLNPWSRHLGITSELVQRRIAGHHLGILNHCICDWHPRELHLKKSCLLMGKSSSLWTDSRDPCGVWWESFYRHSSSWFMLFFYSFFLSIFTYLLIYS